MPGVAQFLETVLKMDEHEFTAKMEAFALHGLKGSIQLIKHLSFIDVTTTRCCYQSQASSLGEAHSHPQRDQ